jgi:hypothetical protein
MILGVTSDFGFPFDHHDIDSDKFRVWVHLIELRDSFDHL